MAQEDGSTRMSTTVARWGRRWWFGRWTSGGLSRLTGGEEAREGEEGPIFAEVDDEVLEAVYH